MTAIETKNSVMIKQKPKRSKTAALRAYHDQKPQQVTQQQITELLPMIHSIAQKVISYLKPPLSYDDLISAGTVGLVRAARDYDPSRKAGFKTYAYIRIKGSILDELRGWSFVPTNINKQIRTATEASSSIAKDTGSTPSDVQLAEKLGISIDKLYKTFEQARIRNFLSIDNNTENDKQSLGALLSEKEFTGPDKNVERIELLERLAEAIEQLPQRQRQIILLYYNQHLTMKQITKVFSITEPRVSQLHSAALFNLSVKLKEWKDG